MKTRIEIRGVITSAMTDSPWLETYISKGMLTPESRIRSAINAAGNEIELYINSQGGDVFAGNEIIVALKAAMQAGKQVEITVGAMAFSMAANILAMLPGVAKIQAYSNSRIGYHGAYTYTEGGVGAHKDGMQMLADINAQVIVALKSKGVKGDVESWFSEGRIKFLTAAQALKLGIIDSIIGEEDTALASLEKEVAEKLMQDGLDIAACADEHIEAISDEAVLSALKPVEQPDIVSQVLAQFASMDVLAVIEKINGAFAASGKPSILLAAAGDDWPDRLSKLQAAKDKEISSLKTDHDSALQALTVKFEAEAQALKDQFAQSSKDLAETKVLVSSLTTERDESLKALAVASKQLIETKNAHAKLIGGALKPNGEYASFEAAAKKIGVTEARVKYPELYQSFMLENGANVAPATKE
jgi:ATP-dependent protease ClpP protease subunit